MDLLGTAARRRQGRRSVQHGQRDQSPTNSDVVTYIAVGPKNFAHRHVFLSLNSIRKCETLFCFKLRDVLRSDFCALSPNAIKKQT